jgi:hypothetical protein
MPKGLSIALAKLGVINAAAIERFHPTADPMGQASGYDSTRR